MNAFDELRQIVAALRAEGGCPWDRAQTPATLRPYLLEEVYEVLQAIDGEDPDELRNELGDLLFQVTLLSQMHAERGDFDLDDVLATIQRKMIDRHPHVFDPSYVAGPDEGSIAAWEARKAQERDGGSALDGVPAALPALLRAHRVSEKAAGVGFDWPDISGVRRKVSEELAELDAALAGGDEREIGEEFGDLLFTLVNLGRFLPVPAEDALRRATDKFSGRFRHVEQALASEGRLASELTPDALEALWQRAKADTCS